MPIAGSSWRHSPKVKANLLDHRECKPFELIGSRRLGMQTYQIPLEVCGMLDRKLLKQAVSELVMLKSCGQDLSRFLGQLYISALEEWAERLSLEPFKLNKLVQIRETITNHRLH